MLLGTSTLLHLFKSPCCWRCKATTMNILFLHCWRFSPSRFKRLKFSFLYIKIGSRECFSIQGFSFYRLFVPKFSSPFLFVVNVYRGRFSLERKKVFLLLVYPKKFCWTDSIHALMPFVMTQRNRLDIEGQKNFLSLTAKLEETNFPPRRKWVVI